MRKVLSFVLVLSLVLGSFSMAFAATPASSAGLSDIADSANVDAIQVSYDLGIVTGNPDGTFLPEKTVNRAEFAAMITRALAIPESALAGYTATKFKDTAGYGWAVPYLAFCESKGIMLGDGQGNAMPGRTINVNEAMTMVLRAVGYTANSAELVGAWPANYVTKAQELKLYVDVATTTNVDKASAAQIIYNALTVQKVAVNADGDTTPLWDNTAKTIPTTLLSAGLNCDSALGVMGEDFGEDSLINIQRYVGQYGTVYTNTDDEIVAFISESTQLVGKYVSGSTDWNDNFKTLSGDTYTNNATTAGIALMYNGTSEDTGAISSGKVYVINADVSGKRINEIYSVMEWNTESYDKVVTSSDLDAIEDDQSLLGVDFTLDDDDEIDLNSFLLVGVASLDDISVDNVVYVYPGGSDNEITRIEVGTKTVEGVVSTFKDSKATIGGTAYKNAFANANGLADNSMSDTQVSKNVKVYIDANGYIYDFDELDNTANNVAVQVASDAGIDYQVKLYTAEDKSTVYTVRNAAVYGELPGDDNLLVYGLNKDGKVSSVTDGGTRLALPIGAKFLSNSVVTASSLTYRISSDVVVFVKNGSANYDLTTIDKVKKDGTISVAGQLLLNDKNVVIGIIVAPADAKASAEDVYGVVNAEYAAVDADGDKVLKIEGFADGKKIEALTDSDATVLSANWNDNTFTTLGGVQLYKFEMDSDGVITGGNTAPGGDYALVVENATVKAIDGRKAIQDTDNVWYALASDVVIYEYVVADGEYRVYNGSLLKDWKFSVYELDNDSNGAEIVFFIR